MSLVTRSKARLTCLLRSPSEHQPVSNEHIVNSHLSCPAAKPITAGAREAMSTWLIPTCPALMRSPVQHGAAENVGGVLGLGGARAAVQGAERLRAARPRHDQD
jgi:hypothetical protein